MWRVYIYRVPSGDTLAKWDYFASFDDEITAMHEVEGIETSGGAAFYTSAAPSEAHT